MTDIAVMPPTWVRCRTFGHAWDDVEPSQDELDDSAIGTALLVANCRRCGTHRTDTLSALSGTLVARTYAYPSGYLLPKGEVRPKRDAYRLQLLGNRLAELRNRGKR